MSSAEDSGSKCSSGPISSFTIQSILGTPSDAPRSGNKELSKGPPPPPRRRSLSVSSEEECSGGEDSADCFCSDTGHSEPCTQHQAHNFCLGPPKGLLSGSDGLPRRPHLPQPLLQDYKEEQERPCHQMSPLSEERQTDGADKQGNSAKKKLFSLYQNTPVIQITAQEEACMHCYLT